jgi:hypothetical protein
MEEVYDHQTSQFASELPSYTNTAFPITVAVRVP